MGYSFRDIFSLHNDKEVRKMFTIMAIIIYMFEFVLSIAAIGFMAMVVAYIFDRSSNKTLNRISSYILDIRDEDLL